MRRTPEQIRTIGLSALKRELGAAGMLRFLQQFSRGSGDWAGDRADWAQGTTLADICKAATSALARPANRRRPRKSGRARGLRSP